MEQNPRSGDAAAGDEMPSEVGLRASAPTAAPPVRARVLAFAAIVAGGAAGGFIGWAFADLQCTGDCTVVAGMAGVVGAVGAALGVGIVAVLALRAIGEWQAQQQRGAEPPPERGLIARRREEPPAGRSRPRVR